MIKTKASLASFSCSGELFGENGASEESMALAVD